MARQRIAAYHALFVLLGVICVYPAMAEDSPGCQAQLELIPPQHSRQSPVDIQIDVPSGTQGVNFKPYLRRLTASVMRNLLSRIPESMANGERRTVVIRVQMQKDWSLSKNGLSIACTSGRKDMDAAAQSAIRRSAI